MLQKAISRPDMLILDQPGERPDNWHFVTIDKKNNAVLVKLSEEKNNFEILNWQNLNDRTLAQKIKRAGREGGLVLITGNDPRSAGLSDLPASSRLNKALDETGIKLKKEGLGATSSTASPEEKLGDLKAPSPNGDVPQGAGDRNSSSSQLTETGGSTAYSLGHRDEGHGMPEFYSTMERLLEQKIQGKSASPDQVRGLINGNNGVKAEEIKWSGIHDIIDRLTEELEGFLRLRVGSHGVIFEYEMIDRVRTITCVFAGSRRWIYEVFQSRFTE